MAKMKPLDIAAISLLIIGGVNWGLVGLFRWNIVEKLFGQWEILARIIYGLVGLSALYSIYSLSKVR